MKKSKYHPGDKVKVMCINHKDEIGTIINAYGKSYLVELSDGEFLKQEHSLAPVNEYYDSHYNKLDKQPIEIMQEELSHIEFIGFLRGQIIKYKYRAGLKDGESYEKDKTKQKRYETWLEDARKGLTIDPRK